MGLGVHPGCMGERGFGPQIDQMGAFGAKFTNPFDGGGGGKNHAFPVPGVGAEIHHAHQVGAFVGPEDPVLEGNFRNPGGEVLGMFAGQSRQRLEGKHPGRLEVRGRASDSRWTGKRGRVIVV